MHMPVQLVNGESEMIGKFGLRYVIAASLIVAALNAAAYDSGSSGADGAFNPTVSQTVQLPPNGLFNYTSVNIPAGVTITYKKNAANTPVTILASGDVSIAGIINVSATTVAGDVGMPGVGGPGGFDGGRGGSVSGDVLTWVSGNTGPNAGRGGIGPGGGTPAKVIKPPPFAPSSIALGPGGGGAYGTAPEPVGSAACSATPGRVYGNLSLLPLVGGSGGGGGAAGVIQSGSGGGGGGGAILIAASGTLDVTGSILANGGVPVVSTASGRGSQGGGGSGGAIRLISSTITGNGTLSAMGGTFAGENSYMGSSAPYYTCTNGSYNSESRYGGAGRIRIEAEVLSRTQPTTPPFSTDLPGPTFVPGGTPTLAIANIGGMPVPTTPTGTADIVLPSGTNPVTVTFLTKGVTVGSTITLTLSPPIGPALTATSSPTTGTVDSATSSVSVDIPPGSSTLQASVTYTVLASAGDAMSIYAEGEHVEKIRLSSTLGGPSTATLITKSGREFAVPAKALAQL
jgi:hypothetical protein